MILSNTVNHRVWPDHYKANQIFTLLLQFRADQIDLPNINTTDIYKRVTQRHRNQQTPALLHRLYRAISPCKHKDWLKKRQIADTSDIYSINCSQLSSQDLLDLCICPDDHIIDDHGMRPINGPAFLDIRDNQLVGVCIRNTTTDLTFARDAKYTFSNAGWFLWGYDLYEPNDEIVLVEGVFDALAMRHFGYNSIAIGSCHPYIEQLACLKYKFNNIKILLDNDLHGHYGAYCASLMINAPVILSTLKDPGCHFESNTPLALNNVTNAELKALLIKEIKDYNLNVATGQTPVRNLPYN